MPGARVASGERVTLRTVEREDVPFLQRPKANPELRYPLGWDVKNRAQVEADFEDDFGGDDLFLVCLDGDDAGPGSPDEDDVRRIGLVLVGGQSGAGRNSASSSSRRFTGRATARRPSPSSSITSSG